VGLRTTFQLRCKQKLVNCSSPFQCPRTFQGLLFVRQRTPTIFFVNSSDDCTEGFYFSTLANNGLEGGCRIRCKDGEMVVLDFQGYKWQCKNVNETEARCPGKFNIECPENPVGPDIIYKECECETQLLVTADCKEVHFLFAVPRGATLHGAV
jgi:hypothetical protein